MWSRAICGNRFGQHITGNGTSVSVLGGQPGLNGLSILDGLPGLSSHPMTLHARNPGLCVSTL